MVQQRTRRGIVLLASIAVIGVAIFPTAAHAADGPIDLGTAETFAVLGGSEVTFAATGPTTVFGDVGVSPGTSVTGQENLVQTGGSVYAPPSLVDQAKSDLGTAYGVADGLTPIVTGLGDLTGLSLVPGVYEGDLSLTGTLTLAGNEDAYWVFQASSSLIVGSDAEVIVTGGANSCNVFWQVPTSATIDGSELFVGTVMADQSITVTSGATIEGRLLALNAAVTLDNDTITRPSGCDNVRPAITSAGPLAGTAGTAYSYTVTASGTPTPTYAITAGTLPTGLGLDATSGVISGTPTTPGTYTFTVTASNGTSADASATYTVAIAAPTVTTPANAENAVAAGEQLAESGSSVVLPIVIAGTLLAAGSAFFFIARGAQMARRR